MQKVGQNPRTTWHQMTVQFKCYDEQTNRDVKTHTVLERREYDTSEQDWRICYLE